MSLNIEFISAGAGSGKTYTLTEKLKELLASNTIQPRGVIATTFTRMAAGELRERVREALMQSGQIELANQMGQASINTVNGVCGELLKRFSFEAGLSPEQIVLEEGQAQRLFGEAMDQVLDTNGLQVKKLNGLAHRLNIYDRQKNPEWHKHVKNIADAARSNNSDLSQLSNFAEQSTKELLVHFRKPTSRDLDGELLTAINSALIKIDTETDTTKATANYIQLIKGVQAALYNHRVSWAEWVKLSKTNPAVKSKPVTEPIKLIAAEYELHPQLQDDIGEYNKAIFQLAAKSLESYQQLKKQQGLVDFVDQELQLYKLLEEPQVQQTLNSELQLLMVDEFQDTSPIQLALFVRLAAFAKKVIWVGDIKQAIYGFRGSDPSLMQAVLKVIVAEGKEARILEKSWRSRPTLVEYCNNIFSEAFANSIPREQVELIPAIEELTNEPAVQRWSMTGSNMAKKMASIAAGIKELVEEGYTVIDKQSKAPRPVVYGDIAALCRSNSRLADLAKACNDAGISVGYKRPGLLATPEGALAMACLKRLADPMDTLASAEIISLVSCESVDEWLPGRLKYLESGLKSAQWGETTEDETKVLGALATVRKSLNILTPKEAIKEAIAKGNVRAVINQWGPSTNKCKARLANIDCLIELASDYEQHCEVLNIAATVSGLVMWLYELQDREEDWQAVGKDNDTLTLVTHHGAKGLEWPVVLAVDLEKDVRTRLWDLSVMAREDEFDVNAPLEGRSLRFWPYPFGRQSAGIDLKDKIEASEAGIQAMQQAIEEEKRLLYVSLTRPRDLLIIPLPPKGTCKALDTLGVDWILPEGDSLMLPNGVEIPTLFKKCEVD
ncbi:MAG: UvrD-helicase domain-containing protein, partial [bacterium]|nr:UvrD-helicase domain-containing protein [bacterium]